MSLQITQGDDELVEFVVRDNNQALVDLTGSVMWFYVKVSTADADADAIIAKGTSDVVVDPDQVANKGQATVAIASADTVALSSLVLDRDLLYELQLKDTDDKISTIARGTIVIGAQVVRATT